MHTMRETAQVIEFNVAIPVTAAGKIGVAGVQLTLDVLIITVVHSIAL